MSGDAMEILEIAYMILYNLEHKRGITPAVLGHVIPVVSKLS